MKTFGTTQSLHLLSVTVLGVLLGGSVANGNTDCLMGYVGFNGVCYKSFTGSSTRDEARQACEADGAMLAMPKDSETNAFLASLEPVTGGRWLGVTDTDGDGQWVFEDGQTLTYSNWKDGEPNHGSNCAAFYGITSNWDSRHCNHRRGYICQRNADCLMEYVGFNGVCYKSFTGSSTRNEARQACEADGAMLAMPKDSETNAFLDSLPDITYGRWLGLTDTDGDGLKPSGLAALYNDTSPVAFIRTEEYSSLKALDY
ncbi:C-type lectin lectoxin-Lio3-like [Branchiostoma floridae x Branchiostoma japonicum]